MLTFKTDIKSQQNRLCWRGKVEKEIVQNLYVKFRFIIAEK